MIKEQLAAVMKDYPKPWRIEEDWTTEIRAANNKLITKLFYPQDLSLGHAIVEMVNRYGNIQDILTRYEDGGYYDPGKYIDEIRDERLR